MKILAEEGKAQEKSMPSVLLEESAVVKAAKKHLQKVDAETSVKLKELVALIAASSGPSSSDPDEDKAQKKKRKQIRAWIEQSSKFIVKKKMVTLKKSSSSKDKKKEKKNRKRNAVSPPSSDLESATSPPSSKKSRKSPGQDTTDQWRKDNKIVLLDYTAQDAKGQALSKQHNENPSFYPWISFDLANRSNNNSSDTGAGIEKSLIAQCTGSTNNFVRPSPIQSQAWPILCSSRSQGSDIGSAGRDMVGIAETGSGKTLAFALPALSAMAREDQQSSRKGRRSNYRLPRMLVLSPTRELAMQSDVVLQEFGAVVGLTSLVIYGGVPKHTQTNELKRGSVDCIVATPGRLKDLVNQGSCDLSSISQLVLDEADRMLDMGFEEDVRFIITQCMLSAKGRQTAMFSATWPAAIQAIASEYMVNPVRVYVGFEAKTMPGGDASGSDGDSTPAGADKDGGLMIMDDSLSANKRVTQNVEVIEDHLRPGRLLDLLRQEHSSRKNRVLVFALYKKEAERLEWSLKKNGWNCSSIHGNKNQQARTEALQQFRDGTCPLLVATDVAARGLDIPNVEVVINYTFPLTIEDYIHRIGRTGRAGNTGISHTFFQPTDKARAGELQQVMRQAGQASAIPEALLNFGSTIKKKEHNLYGRFGPRDNGQPMKQATKIKFDDSDDEN